MSPIDDELRAALHGRAQVLAPSPDPLAGIERRAHRIRRNRIAASVAASALAVAAIAVAVPALQDATSSSGPRPPQVATSDGPTLPATSAYVLDPAKPWAYRGDPALNTAGDIDAYTVQWAAKHGVLTDDVAMTLLFGQVYEPSATPEVVYLVHNRTSGERWWGVAQATESGPEILWDEQLPDPAFALAAALPGDEVARLLVVAAPGTTTEYGPDGASEYAAMAVLADGVSTKALEGDPATDSYRVLDTSGEVVVRADAPDSTTPTPPDAAPQVDTAAYGFDLSDPWAYRGPQELTQHPNLAVEDGRLFQQNGSRGDGWSDRPLLGYESADGLSVLMVLHRSGSSAVVTTTWQVQDEAARQSEQPVAAGQLLLQSALPLSDGSTVLVALASPKTGAVELSPAAGQRIGGEEDFGVWRAKGALPQTSVFLYSGGDGLLFHQEPARRS